MTNDVKTDRIELTLAYHSLVPGIAEHYHDPDRLAERLKGLPEKLSNWSVCWRGIHKQQG
jgi:hypothetical protein